MFEILRQCMRTLFVYTRAMLLQMLCSFYPGIITVVVGAYFWHNKPAIWSVDNIVERKYNLLPYTHDTRNPFYRKSM